MSRVAGRFHHVLSLLVVLALLGGSLVPIFSPPVRPSIATASDEETEQSLYRVRVRLRHPKDLERVKEIRQTIGTEPHLFVDGNQGCNLSEYLPVFQKMEKYDLAFIEQPLPIWDIGGYQKLCAKLVTPILIDEGVYTPNDLMTLIKYQAADAVNIKILKTGLTGGKKIAAIVESAGLPCHLGSMFETGIGTAVSIHFAISTRSISNSSECFFPTLFAEDVIEGDIYSTMPEIRVKFVR